MVHGTRLAIQGFTVRLFSMGAWQPSVFSYGRAKCQIVWKPGLSILDIVRIAPMTTNALMMLSVHTHVTTYPAAAGHAVRH